MRSAAAVAVSLAERMEEIFERCDSKDVAACKANWEDIARRLEDYGMDEFDELIDLLPASAPDLWQALRKGHYAVYSGFGKGSGGHSGGRPERPLEPDLYVGREDDHAVRSAS